MILEQKQVKQGVVNKKKIKKKSSQSRLTHMDQINRQMQFALPEAKPTTLRTLMAGVPPSSSSLHGGGGGGIDIAGGIQHKDALAKTNFWTRVPRWLDVLLYTVIAFLFGAVIFFVLHSCLCVQQNIRSKVSCSKLHKPTSQYTLGDNPSFIDHVEDTANVHPPHPPPPPDQIDTTLSDSVEPVESPPLFGQTPFPIVTLGR